MSTRRRDHANVASASEIASPALTFTPSCASGIRRSISRGTPGGAAGLLMGRPRPVDPAGRSYRRAGSPVSSFAARPPRATE